jgi:hypothetical protein
MSAVFVGVWYALMTGTATEPACPGARAVCGAGQRAAGGGQQNDCVSHAARVESVAQKGDSR